MKSSFCFAAAALTLATVTLVGCANDASEVGSTTQHDTVACVTQDAAKAKFDHAVKVAQDQIQVDYAAAMADYKQGVADAQAQYQSVLNSIPSNDPNSHNADTLNAAVAAYNAQVAQGGPLDQAYDVAVSIAKAKYKHATDAATAEWNTTTFCQ